MLCNCKICDKHFYYDIWTFNMMRTEVVTFHDIHSRTKFDEKVFGLATLE